MNKSHFNSLLNTNKHPNKKNSMTKDTALPSKTTISQSETSLFKFESPKKSMFKVTSNMTSSKLELIGNHLRSEVNLSLSNIELNHKKKYSLKDSILLKLDTNLNEQNLTKSQSDFKARVYSPKYFKDLSIQTIS